MGVNETEFKNRVKDYQVQIHNLISDIVTKLKEGHDLGENRNVILETTAIAAALSINLCNVCDVVGIKKEEAVEMVEKGFEYLIEGLKHGK